MIHTREGHVPDLSDCPPAKLNRGDPSLRIGAPGPKGRILIRGEYGHDIIDDLAPLPGEPVIDKPGKGSFHGTSFGELLEERGITSLVVTGVTTEVCVHTTVREANDRGYECLVLVGLRRLLLPRVPARRPGDDRRTGRHLRLGRAVGRVPAQRCPTSAVRAVRPCRRFRHDHDDGAAQAAQAPLVGRGDTNAFFGLGFNILVNVLVLSGLCLGVVHIPGAEVFGAILPGAGRRSC